MDILIIRFSSLGDIILTTGVVEALKQRFPESNIYYLTKHNYSGIFLADPRIFRIVSIQGDENPFEILRKTGRKKFDVVLDLHSSIRSIGIYYLLDAPLKKRVNKHSLARRFMIWSGNRFRRHFDVLGSYFETLKPLGITEKALPKLIPDEGKQNDTRKLLGSSKQQRTNRIIGIAPGARHHAKRWNEESFANLADEISRRGDKPVFIGDTNDRDVIGRIGNRMTGEAVSLAGETDLATTISVISQLDGLVSNDSGPMHIGGALGIPFAAVFGPTHPDLGFCPGYRSGKILNSGAVCSPCSLHGSAPCRKESRFCMDDITWDAVFKTLDLKIGESST